VRIHQSGIGHFGLSENAVTRDFGAAVILGLVVTTANLIPTGLCHPKRIVVMVLNQIVKKRPPNIASIKRFSLFVRFSGLT